MLFVLWGEQLRLCTRHVGDDKYLVALHVTIGIIITLGIITTMGIITMCTPTNQLNVNFISDLGNSLVSSRSEH